MAAFFRKQVESKKHLGMLVLFARRAMQRFLDYVTDLRLMLLVQGDQPRYRLLNCTANALPTVSVACWWAYSPLPKVLI